MVLSFIFDTVFSFLIKKKTKKQKQQVSVIQTSCEMFKLIKLQVPTQKTTGGSEVTHLFLKYPAVTGCKFFRNMIQTRQVSS